MSEQGKSILTATIPAAFVAEEITVTITIKPRPLSRKATPETVAEFVRSVFKGREKHPNLIAAWGDVEVVAVQKGGAS